MRQTFTHLITPKAHGAYLQNSLPNRSMRLYVSLGIYVTLGQSFILQVCMIMKNDNIIRESVVRVCGEHSSYWMAHDRLKNSLLQSPGLTRADGEITR